jgi:acyl-coenzyme A thioesterase PaaI-like protein
VELVSREDVEANFRRQPAMALIGASIRVLAAGIVEVSFPYRRDLT